jgi:N-acetylglucosaminyldiphosphoundecaprenol N-acetyl-beta-D-mannosaminyltransferase
MSTLSVTNRARVKVLGYPVDIVDEPIALEIIESAWREEANLHVITLNAEMVIQAQKDPDLDRIIRRANLIIPDGAGIVFAQKLYGRSIQRLPGIELAEAALKRAANAGRSVVLLGAKPEVLQAVKQILPERYKGLNIVAAYDGYYRQENEEELVEALCQISPELLLVALGVPRQEYFIDTYRDAFPNTVMIGVGGSFDVWAGVVNRAPSIMCKLHLEWLYRLYKEPWRYKRMASSLPNFAFQAIFRRFFGPKED